MRKSPCWSFGFDWDNVQQYWKRDFSYLFLLFNSKNESKIKMNCPFGSQHQDPIQCTHNDQCRDISRQDTVCASHEDFGKFCFRSPKCSEGCLPTEHCIDNPNSVWHDYCSPEQLQIGAACTFDISCRSGLCKNGFCSE